MRGQRALISLFTVAVTLSAALLFVVQPMTARGLLPLLGGSPAVWTTAMLFFQTMLLAGYLWAHWIGTRRGAWAVGLHAVMLGTCAVAVVTRGWRHGEQDGADPTLWMLGEMLISVGPGFFAISSAGPLLQRWFARTNRPGGPDPYTLYAASNAGSVAGLLAYPLLIEPALGLGGQRAGWTIAFMTAGVLIAACGVIASRAGQRRAPAKPIHAPEAGGVRPTWRLRLGWIGLAFIPSSLMLGVTTYLTTDIAAFPLLWVIPLAIYLVTFIVAFAVPGRLPLVRISRYASLAVLFTVATILLDAKHPLPVLMLLHLAALAGVGLVCHGRLASLRPHTDRLTEFYVWISIGGMLGGVFNALVAPAVFNSVAEYPAVLAVSGLAGVGSAVAGRLVRRWWIVPASLLIAVAVSWMVMRGAESGRGLPVMLVTVGVPLAIAAAACSRPVSSAACVAILLAWGGPPVHGDARLEYAERTFFGVHRVQTLDEPVPHRRLMHGTTVHGVALLDRPTLPTVYYHPAGPIGDVFSSLSLREGTLEFAGVGLGIGSIAAYARPGDRFTFLEIDRAVVEIATDRELFRFIAESPGEIEIEVGDGRIGLERRPAGSFDLIVVDAFSSDAIPVHLLTLEAFEIYLDRLKPGGLLALHLSNQHLDLAPVVTAIARDLGATVRIREDDAPRIELSRNDLLDASIWAVLARDDSTLTGAVGRARWVPPEPTQRRAWTDNYSDVLGVIRWDTPTSDR